MKRALWMGIALATTTFATGTWAAGDIAAGLKKAGACAGCHGAKGEGKGPSPALAGLAEAKLVAAMNEIKSGKRGSKMMKAAMTPLTDSDIANLAAFYASIKPK